MSKDTDGEIARPKIPVGDFGNDFLSRDRTTEMQNDMSQEIINFKPLELRKVRISGVHQESG